MTSQERRTRQTRKYREQPEITQEVGQSARRYCTQRRRHRVGLLEAAAVPALRHQVSELLLTGITRAKCLPGGIRLQTIFHRDPARLDYAPCVDPSRLYICVARCVRIKNCPLATASLDRRMPRKQFLQWKLVIARISITPTQTANLERCKIWITQSLTLRRSSILFCNERAVIARQPPKPLAP